MGTLALVLAQLDEQDAAIELIRRTLSVQERLLGRRHPNYVVSLGILSWILAVAGRVDESLAVDLETLELAEQVFGPEHPDVARIHDSLGHSYEDLGDFELAAEQFARAAGLRARVFGIDHSVTEESALGVARCVSRLSDPVAADRWHRWLAEFGAG